MLAMIRRIFFIHRMFFITATSFGNPAVLRQQSGSGYTAVGCWKDPWLCVPTSRWVCSYREKLSACKCRPVNYRPVIGGRLTIGLASAGLSLNKACPRSVGTGHRTCGTGRYLEFFGSPAVPRQRPSSDCPRDPWLCVPTSRWVCSYRKHSNI